MEGDGSHQDGGARGAMLTFCPKAGPLRFGARSLLAVQPLPSASSAGIDRFSGSKVPFLIYHPRQGEQEPLRRYYLTLYVWAFVPPAQDSLWEFPVPIVSPPLLKHTQNRICEVIPQLSKEKKYKKTKLMSQYLM